MAMCRQPVAAAHTARLAQRPAHLQASSWPAVARRPSAGPTCQATSISTLIGNGTPACVAHAGAVQEVLLPLMEHSEAGAAPVAVSVHLPNSPATLPARATYDALAEAGAKKTLLPALTIFLSSTMAGCYIAFGGLLSTVVQAGLQSLVPTLPGLVKLVGGLVFPIGLTLVTLSGVQLYTGNTGTVSMAVYQKKADVRGLMHNWFWSYTGNFVGSLLMVAAVHTSGVLEGNQVTISVAEAKSGLTFMQAFVRGVLANWLVCMAVWNTFAATSVPGKIISLWPCIASFVTLGLEHSVANMYLIPMGIALGAKVTLSQFMLHNLLPVTLGNTVAGAVVFAGGFSFLYGSLGQQLLGGGLLAQ